MNEMLSSHEKKLYLKPTFYLDFSDPIVVHFSEHICTGPGCDKQKAIELYYGVRDKIKYDPYDLHQDRKAFCASSVIRKGYGYCVAKAVLLTALLRLNQIPARLGFADVTNHLSTKKLYEIMKSNLFIYHGYTEVYLDGKWVKATPAFNLALCERFHVKPLEFDGENDSIFHEYNTQGQKHMEYIHDHGHFTDLPYDRIFSAYKKEYPGMFQRFEQLKRGNFAEEAEKESNE